jgi:RNA polymerase sigma-70 factor (ECF subfamily)
VAEGKGERFEHLKPYLSAGKGDIPYATAAVALAMDEGAVRVAVHRLRKRYRALLRDEVAQTLGDPAMVNEELATLFGAFG